MKAYALKADDGRIWVIGEKGFSAIRTNGVWASGIPTSEEISETFRLISDRSVSSIYSKEALKALSSTPFASKTD